jgi:2-polyprenyl-3-methyl-5-hydroxy-6-metoxy-1,4-benzoquinol methylase
MNQHQKCIVCNSAALYTKEKYSQAFLTKCKNCSMVFSQRIPTDQELMEHYSNSYSREDVLSPITIIRYHEILDTFEKYRITNNLLDVGCGVGYFLDIAKERGWNVYGTEYTESALKINRDKGFTMHEGKLNSENYPENHFDIVTSFEVIEHINNPQEDIEKVKKILRKGGALYATTPNFDSLSRRNLKENWNVIGYPEHLSYYTPTSMNFLLKSFGFQEAFIQTTGFSFTRFKKSKDKTITESHVQGNTTDEALRISIESKWYMGLAKNIVNKILTLFSLGDTLKVMYVKS